VGPGVTSIGLALPPAPCRDGCLGSCALGLWLSQRGGCLPSCLASSGLRAGKSSAGSALFCAGFYLRLDVRQLQVKSALANRIVGARVGNSRLLLEADLAVRCSRGTGGS